MKLVSRSTTLVHVLVFYLHFLWRLIKSTKPTSKHAPLPEPNGALPFIGHLHLLNANVPICKQLATIADKCGPIFSLKLGFRNLLVVSNWEIAKECLTTHDRVLASRAKIAAGKHMGYNDAVLPLAPYGEYWRQMRKMLTVHLLSDRRVKSDRHVRTAEVSSFIKELGESRLEVNLSELLVNMTFNINLKITVGKRFSDEEYRDHDSVASRYKKSVHRAVYLCGVLTTEDAFPCLGWLNFQGHARSMKETAREIDGILVGWLEEHLMKRKIKAEQDREVFGCDYMDVMLSTLPEDTVLEGHTRDTIVKATALILTLNGGESTGVTLTWTISLLLNHADVLKALQEEMDAFVGKQRWVQESDIENLRLLQAVVKETLRLYPPGPITGIREAAGSCRIGGYEVAKGSRLVLNIWKLHRDPRVWDDPDAFFPERFLRERADFDVRGQRFEYLPFSSGRRACPGISFAMNVVQLTLAWLVQGFDIMRVGGAVEVDMAEGPGLALPKKTPVNVVLAPRLPLELYKCP